LDSGLIDQQAWEAARRWRTWAEVAAPLPRQRWTERVDESRSMASEWHVIDKVAILTKLREANEALGPLRQRLLELSVRDDRSWREI
jgi:hypothetical protein